MEFQRGFYAGLSTPQGSLNYPKVLGYEESRAMIWSAPESAPILGVDGEGNAVSVDLDSESPHILISASTGAGKSVISRSIATQALINGADVVILDAKRHSHRWAKNLPHVHYASSCPEIGDALVSIGMELHRRNEIVEHFHGPIEQAPVGPRIVVLFEEMNATMDALTSLSKKLPGNTYTAMDAFQDIMFLGRAAKVHVVAMAQLATAQATGGSAMRESFSTRIMLRYTKQAWYMLAHDCGAPQPAPEATGRGMVCRGGKARQTQFLYLTEEQAAYLVRTAYEARQRAGLDVTYSKRDMKRQAKGAQAALMRARG